VETNVGCDVDTSGFQVAVVQIVPVECSVESDARGFLNLSCDMGDGKVSGLWVLCWFSHPNFGIRLSPCLHVWVQRRLLFSLRSFLVT
jgi:hypothetical protein